MIIQTRDGEIEIDCDSPYPPSIEAYVESAESLIDDADDVVRYRCRCMVCDRCGHHTGNSHQGHYWAHCSATGTTREFHFCCPDNCELEAMNT